MEEADQTGSSPPIQAPSPRGVFTFAKGARPGIFESTVRIEMLLIVNKAEADNLVRELRKLEAGIEAVERAIAILTSQGYDMKSEAVDALEEKRDHLLVSMKNTLYELIGASEVITQLKIRIGEA